MLTPSCVQNFAMKQRKCVQITNHMESIRVTCWYRNPYVLDITYLEDDHVIANILDNYLSSVKPNLSQSKHFR